MDEQKFELIMVAIREVRDDVKEIKDDVKKQNGRVRKLEVRNGYLAGIGAALIFAVPILLKVLF